MFTPSYVAAGTSLFHSKYGAENVTERDFLRTEGDPAAAGYTITEAVALTRSVVSALYTLVLVFLQGRCNTSFCMVSLVTRQDLLFSVWIFKIV